ncbi:hypothetical protein PsorP6_011057 [Peronosclerospora sorghi]|uniref:Uncharacterized protein n=1 Tax=Peronosclerospora sorghi TaxID=230839 RepID=A0ACC0VVP9_9STRA|nr:hypothetical protein PsorP6_011057 [Peronosclerospora sorghi]
MFISLHMMEKCRTEACEEIITASSRLEAIGFEPALLWPTQNEDTYLWTAWEWLGVQLAGLTCTISAPAGTHYDILEHTGSKLPTSKDWTDKPEIFIGKEIREDEVSICGYVSHVAENNRFRKQAESPVLNR